MPKVELRPIRSRAAHRRARARIAQLMGAKPGSRAADELVVLAMLVERYERDAFDLGAATPRDVIEFRMEQLGYRQGDLARIVGANRASELLRGRRPGLSLGMIRKLRAEWGIPADLLIA